MRSLRKEREPSPCGSLIAARLTCCIKITLLLLQPHRMIPYGSWGEIKLCVVSPLALSQSRWQSPPLTRTVTVAPQRMRQLPGRAPILVSMAAMAGVQRTISSLAQCHLLVASSLLAVSPDGGFGGGQIGYNWQGVWHPHLVLGVEADFQGADISDRRTDKFGDILQSKLDWFGTVRGRLGYAFDRTLVYGTGGFAFGGIEKLGDFSPFPFADNVAKVDKTATGYVVGGGIEYKVTPAWSVKAEYQYINLGQNDPKFQSGLSFKRVGNTVDDDAFHTVRAGINYHFGGGYEPLK